MQSSDFQNDATVVEIAAGQPKSSGLGGVLIGTLVGAALGLGALGVLLFKRNQGNGNGDITPPPGISVPETSRYYGGSQGVGVILNSQDLPLTNGDQYSYLASMESVFVLYDEINQTTYLVDESFNFYEVEKTDDGKMTVVKKLVFKSAEWQNVVDDLAFGNTRNNLLTKKGYRTLASVGFLAGDTRLQEDVSQEDNYVDGKNVHLSYFPWPVFVPEANMVRWDVGERSIQWFRAADGTNLVSKMKSQLMAEVTYQLPGLGTIQCYAVGTRAQIKKQTKLEHMHSSYNLAEDQATRWQRGNEGQILSKHHMKNAKEQWRSFNRLVSPDLSLRYNLSPYVLSPIDADQLMKSNVTLGRYHLNGVFDAVDTRRLFEQLKLAPGAVFLFTPKEDYIADEWLKYLVQHTDPRLEEYSAETLNFPAGKAWAGLFGYTDLKFAPGTPERVQNTYAQLVSRTIRAARPMILSGSQR